MDDRQHSGWVAPVVWLAVTVILFSLGISTAPIVDEEVWSFFGSFTGGLAVAYGLNAYRSRRQSLPSPLLPEQVLDLQAQLEEAESQIERLRAELDFDRKLPRPEVK